MSKIIPYGALVVVADGHQAILLRNKGTPGNLELTPERRLTPENLADEGPSGSRPEEQTARQTDEATFAKQLAHALFAMKHANEYDSLVLVADPQTLGQVRGVLHKTVEASIMMSLAKELTHQPIHEIADVIGRAA